MDDSNPTGAIVLLDDTIPSLLPPLPSSIAGNLIDRASGPTEAELAAGRALGMPHLHAKLLRARAGQLLARPDGSPNVMEDDYRIPDDPEGWSPPVDRPFPFLLRAIVRPCEIGPVAMIVAGKYRMVEETVCRALWLIRPVLLLPGLAARIDPANALLFGTSLSPRETIALSTEIPAGNLAGTLSLYERSPGAQDALGQARAKASGH